MKERKKLHRFKSKILEITNLNNNTKHFRLTAPKDFNFYPGQFISIILDMNGEEIRRPYSIASGPREGEIDLCIKILQNGKATPTISDFKKGKEIEVIGPMGNFYVEDQSLSKSIIFVSTGTGVAPFRSIITNLLENGFKEEIILLTGYRHKEDILYDKEFKKLEKDNKNFTYKTILSQNGEDSGYVQELTKGYLNKKADYYLCGLRDMVNSVSEFLEENNVPEENIFFEKYN